MDKQYSVQFFTKFVEAMQKFCRDYLEFEQVVELSGYLSLEIDNYKKERYILSEMVHNTGDVISESYCVKAFKTMKRLPPRNSNSDVLRDNTNTLRSAQEVSIDLRDSPGQSSQYSIPYQMPSSRHRAQVHQASTHRQNISSQQSFRQNINRRNNPPSFASGGPDPNSYATSSSSHMQEPATIQPRQSVQYLTSSAHSSPVMAVIPSLDDLDSEPDHSSTSNMNQSSTEGGPIQIDENRGQKRSSVQEENTTNKKEKLDSELESLFTAATSIVTEGNVTAHTDSENMPQSEGSNMDIPNSDPSNTQIHPDNETLRLPDTIQIKEEVDDVLFIDSPDDKSNADLGGYGADNQSFTSMQTSSADAKSLQTVHSEWSRELPMSSNVSSIHPGTPYGSVTGAGKFNEVEEKRAFSRQNKLQCDFCGYETLYSFALKRHRRKHTGEAYFCELCPKYFWDRSKLIYHVKGHKGELVCKFCLKKFQTKHGQYRHQVVCSSVPSRHITSNKDTPSSM